MPSIDVINPYDLKKVSTIPFNNDGEIETALSKAYQAHKKSSLPKDQRISILKNLIKEISDHKEKYIIDAAKEGGKPYIDSVVEIERGLQGIQNAIEEIGQLKGREIPMGLNAASKNRMAFTQLEPIGVILAISAFNHPFNLIIHQVITAFAAGCPVIVKPALTTPISCFNIVNALKAAGLPDEWCSVILCENDRAEKLVSDERIAFLTFIGSSKVGWHLRSKLAPGVHCALEHGGVAPVIVEADADLEELLPLLAKGSYYHAGQVCVSVQRIFAEKSIARNLADRLAKLAENLIVGDPLDPKTEVGPLITPQEVSRVESWVTAAKQSGAEILCGGEKISETCYKPTVIFDPDKDLDVSTKEVFGPVVCVYPYEDRLEAIEQANALPFSFQAAVMTKNLDIALDTVKRLEAAAVMVNDHTAFRVDWMPFGGRQQSGMGVGGIGYSIREMSEEKLMVIRSRSLE